MPVNFTSVALLARAYFCFSLCSVTISLPSLTSARHVFSLPAASCLSSLALPTSPTALSRTESAVSNNLIAASHALSSARAFNSLGTPLSMSLIASLTPVFLTDDGRTLSHSFSVKEKTGIGCSLFKGIQNIESNIAKRHSLIVQGIFNCRPIAADRYIRGSAGACQNNGENRSRNGRCAGDF